MVFDKRIIIFDVVFFVLFGRYVFGDICSCNMMWLCVYDIVSIVLFLFNGVVEKKLWYLSCFIVICFVIYDDSIVRMKLIEKFVS